MRPQPLAVVTAVLLFCAISSAAATRTWSATPATANWTLATNWGGTAPNPTNTDAVSFATSTITTLNNNFAANSTFGQITFNNGASTFMLNGNALTLAGNIVNNSACTQTVNFNLVLNSNRTVSANSGPVVLGGAISGNYTLVKAGANNPVILNSAGSSYSAFQINSGPATLGANNAIPTGATLIFAGASGTSSLDLNGKLQTAGAVIIAGTGGAASVVDSAGGGMLKLGGNVTQNPASMTNCTISAPVDLNGATRTFTLNGSNGPVVVSGFIVNSTGTAGLTKAGPGTLFLPGTNSYNGDTTINGGKLLANTGGACSNSAVIVATGATNGVQVLSAGGQWVVGGLTGNSGSYLDFDFTTVIPSTMVAPLQVNGDLALSAAVNFLIRNGRWVNYGNYPLISYTGVLSGTVPTNPLVLPGGVTAILVNNTASKRIDLAFAPWAGGYPDPAEVPVPATRRSLSGLDIFNAGQPITFDFRNDFLGSKTYNYFSNTISQSYGHAPKMFSEEVLTSVANQAPMVQYAQQHPEKLLLCHFNFQEIKVMAQPEFMNFSPGHWIYYPGSTLVSNVTAGNTNLAVVSAANFIQNGTPGSLSNNSVIALIPLDAGGNRLWNQTEFSVVRNISGNVLTVDRGHFRSSATSHAAGTYVAVLPDLYQDETNTVFEFNWSLDCPRDAMGRNCGDVFVAMMAQWFETNQPLERMHGILADVFSFDLGDPVKAANQTKRFYDTDGDGLADNGYDAQRFNRFGLGACEMMRKLRVALGTNRILCADGNGPQWNRLPHLLNGMESEGLTAWNDPYAEDWSSNLNLFRYWKAHAAFDQSLSYVVDKLPTLTGAEYDTNQLHLRRFAAATAAILDIGVTAGGMTNGVTSPSQRAYELFDHLKDGVSNQLGWLGNPHDWMRPATNAANLFSGTAANWTSSNATITLDTNEGAWLVRSTGDPYGPSSTNMVIRYAGQVIPGGDLFIRFRMRAAPFAWFPTNVYRYVTLTVDGRQVNTNTADALTAVASSDGYDECCFYYRKAGPATLTISLMFEGPQDVWIKDFAVYNATDVLAREFDNGAVLANPENNPHTFNLSQLFPGKSFRRILGNAWEDPVTNDGTVVSNTVTVPALDGLFLEFANEAEIAQQQAGLSNFTINAGQTVSFTAAAGSFGLSANAPTFTKLSGVGQITTNGRFTWRAPLSSAGTTNPVALQVTDNSMPPASASGSFNIFVNPAAPVTLKATPATDGVQVQVQGFIGPDYILQTSTNLSLWTSLTTNTPVVLPFDCLDTNTGPARFYRVLLKP